jgi:hypothetical protein
VTSRGEVYVHAAVRGQRRGAYAGMSWAGAISLVVWASRAMEPLRRVPAKRQDRRSALGPPVVPAGAVVERFRPGGPPAAISLGAPVVGRRGRPR